MLTRMLVLWLLSEGPHHGYGIRRILAGDPSMAFWFAIEDAAVYSSLRTLVKLGHVRELGTEREGRRPPRTRYAITRSGRAHFRDLLREAWRTLPGAGEPIALALAATAELPEREVRELAAERESRIARRVEHLRAAERSAPSRAMVKRLRALARAELRWLRAHRKEIS